MLPRLGPTDLAWLAGAGRGCAAAVAATALMRWAKDQNQWLCLGEACSIAAHGGHQGVLTWLHNTGCPWGEQTSAAAAAGGHLEVLKFLRTAGCPWNEDTCAAAAREGFLEVLQWAREHQCPWDERTTENAAENDHPTLLQWALEHGCPKVMEGYSSEDWPSD